MVDRRTRVKRIDSNQTISLFDDKFVNKPRLRRQFARNRIVRRDGKRRNLTVGQRFGISGTASKSLSSSIDRPSTALAVRSITQRAVSPNVHIFSEKFEIARARSRSKSDQGLSLEFAPGTDVAASPCFRDFRCRKNSGSIRRLSEIVHWARPCVRSVSAEEASSHRLASRSCLRHTATTERLSWKSRRSVDAEPRKALTPLSVS